MAQKTVTPQKPKVMSQFTQKVSGIVHKINKMEQVQTKAVPKGGVATVAMQTKTTAVSSIRNVSVTQAQKVEDLR